MHYCMGRLVDRAFCSDARSCGMESGFGECPLDDRRDSDSTFTSKSCCQDSFVNIEGQDELQQGHFFSWLPQLTLLPDLCILLSVTPRIEQHRYTFSDTSPPKAWIDLRVLFQSFLI